MKKIALILVVFLIGITSVSALDCDKCSDCNGDSQCIANYCDGDIDNCQVSTTGYSKIQCGEITVPKLVPKLVSTIVTVIQIIIPVLIIIFGMIDFTKATTASKDDDRKKNQQTFLKRLIAGVLVFVVFAVVKTVFNIVDSDNGSMWECVNCIINNKC